MSSSSCGGGRSGGAGARSGASAARSGGAGARGGGDTAAEAHREEFARIRGLRLACESGSGKCSLAAVQNVMQVRRCAPAGRQLRP
jgi:hypothetical protein